MSEHTIDEQIACVRRELGQRARVYPRLVGSGRMKSADAAREIETMGAVLATLQRVRDEQRPELFA